MAYITLKNKLYALGKDKTFAENIDWAWDIYCNENHNADERAVAQEFLIYAFDLKNFDDLNNQLIALMAERQAHKLTNPEYIPGLSPEHLKLKPHEMAVHRTVNSKKSSEPVIQTLLNKHELLDVNTRDKFDDLVRHPDHASVRYFSNYERTCYRVHIYNGFFYQKGELFDTTRYIAHQKNEYAAFTINANGELSIFKHHGGADRVVHSSMNAGAPVMSAGELEIKNGELIAINTYSGHYQTSLFNIYRALEYFAVKGIDVSKTKIYTFEEPQSTDLKKHSSKVSVQSKTFYEIPAALFFCLVKDGLEQSLNTIHEDVIKYQSASLIQLIFTIKDFITGSNLTQERKKIAGAVKNIAQQLLPLLSNNNSENIQSAKQLKRDLEVLRDENKRLSSEYNKSDNSGRLHQHIEGFIKQIEGVIVARKPMDSAQSERMKLVF